MILRDHLTNVQVKLCKIYGTWHFTLMLQSLDTSEACFVCTELIQWKWKKLLLLCRNNMISPRCTWCRTCRMSLRTFSISWAGQSENMQLWFVPQALGLAHVCSMQCKAFTMLAMWSQGIVKWCLDTCLTGFWFYHPICYITIHIMYGMHEGIKILVKNKLRKRYGGVAWPCFSIVTFIMSSFFSYDR